MPRHRSRRLGVAKVTTVEMSYRRERGLTLFELLITVALLTILAGIAMPHTSRDRFNLWNAQSDLLGDLRRARTDALTKGDHFQIAITGPSAYTEYRMVLQGNNWVRGPVVRSRTLPNNVTFNAVAGPFEFDTRGLLVSPGATTGLQLKDSHTGLSRNVTVWLSGQVAPL